MAVQDWSTDPNQNTSVDGINIAENCPPGNLNNALRAIMAAVRAAFSNVPNGADYVTKSNGSFANQPAVSGRGAILHHNDPSNASGRIFIQAAGGTAPVGMVNGDFLIEV
jgi:hypothetical protein